MKYTVYITERLERRIDIEADSPKEALNKVIDMHEQGEIVLTADDFTESDIYI